MPTTLVIAVIMWVRYVRQAKTASCPHESIRLKRATSHPANGKEISWVTGTNTSTSTNTISGKLRSRVSGAKTLSTNKSVGYNPRQPTTTGQNMAFI